jgi:DNA primase
MRFSPEFIEKVQESNNLVDLISQYTQLRPTGSGLMGRCPFPDHQEKTPSFSVSETKQVYHCFGCGKSGNLFKFLNVYNGMSFPEAVEYLANRAGIPLPEDSAQSSQIDVTTLRKKQISEVNSLAAAFFHEQFKRSAIDSVPKIYALERSLTGDLIEGFQLGYAPAEWDSLVEHLKSKNIDLKVAEEAGLIKLRSQGNGYFDIFRHRLMFPIRSAMGEVIGFGGRVLDNSQPKYLNSPETLLFSKGKSLYGLNETAKYIRTLDQAIVVEGYMDFLALYQFGFKNAVAPLGTALTADHGRALARYTKNILVLFDGDDAGQKAAVRSLPILLQAGLLPKGIFLPDQLDPDEFLKERGQGALAGEIAKAKDLFSLVLGLELRGYRGEVSEKIKLCDFLKPLMESIEDERIRQLYLQEAAQRMNVEVRWLTQSLSSNFTKKGTSATLAPKFSHAGIAPASANFDSQKNLINQKRDLAFAQKTQISSESNKQILDQNAAAEELSQIKIILKDINRFESTLLKLILKERAHLEEFLNTETEKYIIDKETQKAINWITQGYRQNPNKFDTLLSLLISQVDLPEILLSNDLKLGVQVSLSSSSADMEDIESSGEVFLDSAVLDLEKKMLIDCMKRIEERYIITQANRLAEEVKKDPSPEKLEQFMKIQRRRLDLKLK